MLHESLREEDSILKRGISRKVRELPCKKVNGERKLFLNNT